MTMSSGAARFAIHNAIVQLEIAVSTMGAGGSKAPVEEAWEKIEALLDSHVPASADAAAVRPKMKLSDLDAAQKYRARLKEVRALLDKLTGYPAFDAYLTVASEPFSLDNARAVEIVQAWVDKAEKDLRDLGLEIDE